MININFNENTVDDFTIILSDRNHKLLGQIVNVDDFKFKGNLNSAQEISFTVYNKIDDYEEPLWDKIVNLQLVWIKELNVFFEIEVSGTQTVNNTKYITGTSLCEAELSQIPLHNMEINTESDIERDDYVVTQFYNPDNPKGSLLHRVLDKLPHYSIKHVDNSLMGLQGIFSINNKSVYDFLVSECAEQINCLFQFDSTDRSISVYDLYTVCNDCGCRGEFSDYCPDCSSTNLSYYGTDSTILVSIENLTDEIKQDTDVGSIKNCFYLEAGDDDMTSAIIACNPNGSPYIYYFSEDQKKIMSSELVSKLEEYDNLVDYYISEYQELSEEIYDTIDEMLYYQSSMSPTIEIPIITASTEAQKLTEASMSPVGLTTVNKYTSTATVNSALKNYAKVFVKSGCVKVDINVGNFTYVGTDKDGYDYGTWVGSFKISNYSDEEDIAYSDELTIKVTSNYEQFLTQKILKNITSNNNEDGSIYNVLSISNLDDFKKALTYYCYNRLDSFANAIQGVINVLIEENQASTSSGYYNTFYLEYYNKLLACQEEMNLRSTTIDSIMCKQEEYFARRKEIQDILNFEDYLGKDLYLLFCSYRREDTYSNSNFISDGLDNSQIFIKAKEFLELATKELIKSSENQHSISANMYNLLIMDEFKPIKQYFELGNWIRVKYDKDIYRLRLVSYEINGKDLKSINTEFSDLTKTHNGLNDIKSLMSKTQSMASSYSYVSKQALKGEKANVSLNEMRSKGLSSALISIKNNDNEEVTFDKAGILCRKYDDIMSQYTSNQLRITHNQLVYTSDNWESVECALGEHTYYNYIDGELVEDVGYGLSAKFVNAAYISGSQMIGGEIYSENYDDTSGSYLNLNDGTFSLGGGKLTYDGENFLLRGVSMMWNDIEDAPTSISSFTNDANYTTLKEVQSQGYQNESQVTQITKDTVTTSYVNALNVVAGSVSAENITGTTISGKTLSGGKIIQPSDNFNFMIKDGCINGGYANEGRGVNLDFTNRTNGLCGLMMYAPENQISIFTDNFYMGSQKYMDENGYTSMSVFQGQTAVVVAGDKKLHFINGILCGITSA